MVLARLHKCAREAVALHPALAVALVAAFALTKCQSCMLKFLCDGQSVVRLAIIYMDRSWLLAIRDL